MKKSLLKDVHPDNNFLLVDGTTLKNMHELLSALENMDEGTFKHHVNEEKNDFRDWVKDIHKDKKLANILSQVINKESATTAIRRRIKEIEKPDRRLKRSLGNKGNINMNKSSKSQKKFSVTNKVPFPKPATEQIINYRRYEIIAAVIAIVFIISLIGISSQAAQITGAAIGSSQTQEIQFLGLGGVFAVVVLLFAALHAIERHAKKRI